MDRTTVLGVLFVILGIVLILLRAPLSRRASALYLKWGIEVPADRYARQFVFVGVLLAVLGFLTVTGMIHLL